MVATFRCYFTSYAKSGRDAIDDDIHARRSASIRLVSVHTLARFSSSSDLATLRAFTLHDWRHVGIAQRLCLPLIHGKGSYDIMTRHE